MWLAGALVVMLMVGGLAGGIPMAGEAQTSLEVNEAAWVRMTRERAAGQRVKLRLMSGQDLEGVVTKVGAHAVHLSQLTGQEFYDAAVRMDHISAIIVRMRGR